MQPTLVLSARHPGILYINGSFAGELSNQQPLIRPIGMQGPLYLEYRPFSDFCQSMARRLVFSRGELLAESLEQSPNIEAVLWPGRIAELEFMPELRLSESESFQLGGHEFTLNRASMQFSCDGRILCSLPEGAEPPRLYAVSGGIILTGSCNSGKYLLTMDEAMQKQTGFLCAHQLDLESDGRIRAINTPSDLVGHAVLESWRLTPQGLMLVSSEPAWAHGSPRWPQTAAETARAAVEAALAGLDSEAERYLSPALQLRFSLDNLRERCDLCVDMKYAPPDPRPCVGLLTVEGEHIARVSSLYYRAIPSGGPQGPYIIDEFFFAES